MGWLHELGCRKRPVADAHPSRREWSCNPKYWRSWVVVLDDQGPAMQGAMVRAHVGAVPPTYSLNEP